MHRPSLPGECRCGPTWHKSTFEKYPIRIAYVSKRIQRFYTFRNYALIRIFADTYYFVDTENTRIISEISNTIRIKYTNTPYLYCAGYVSNNIMIMLTLGGNTSIRSWFPEDHLLPLIGNIGTVPIQPWIAQYQWVIFKMVNY